MPHKIECHRKWLKINNKVAKLNKRFQNQKLAYRVANSKKNFQKIKVNVTKDCFGCFGFFDEDGTS